MRGSIDFHENVDLILPRKGICLDVYFCPLALCLRPPSSGQYKVGLLQSGQSSTFIQTPIKIPLSAKTVDTVMRRIVSSKKIC